MGTHQAAFPRVWGEPRESPAPSHLGRLGRAAGVFYPSEGMEVFGVMSLLCSPWGYEVRMQAEHSCWAPDLLPTEIPEILTNPELGVGCHYPPRMVQGPLHGGSPGPCPAGGEPADPVPAGRSPIADGQFYHPGQRLRGIPTEPSPDSLHHHPSPQHQGAAPEGQRRLAGKPGEHLPWRQLASESWGSAAAHRRAMGNGERRSVFPTGRGSGGGGEGSVLAPEPVPPRRCCGERPRGGSIALRSRRGERCHGGSGASAAPDRGLSSESSLPTFHQHRLELLGHLGRFHISLYVYTKKREKGRGLTCW